MTLEEEFRDAAKWAALLLLDGPDDFIYVGSGSFRDVYRKGNLVYKIDNEVYGSGNEEEWEAYSHFIKGEWTQKLPKDYAIPRMELLEVADVFDNRSENAPELIIVAEYIEGRGYVADNDEVKLLPIVDPHAGNIKIKDNGVKYIVDLNLPSYRGPYDNER